MGFLKKEIFDGLHNDGIFFFGKFNRLINDEISKKGNVDKLYNPSNRSKKGNFVFLSSKNAYISHQKFPFLEIP